MIKLLYQTRNSCTRSFQCLNPVTPKIVYLLRLYHPAAGNENTEMYQVGDVLLFLYQLPITNSHGNV